ncbi:uncharacterized protein PG998_015029 [Apiospora kogelbergensis]|uniref:uncharacterized protein n=1 Tax=Apiospora kogelbergensis TaxID=1337665 RepID=UPI00312F3711
MSHDQGNISKADAAAYSSSDSDESANDDFGDFNPRKRRRTGHNAKDSAALGIFGSDSEDDGPGRRWKGKKDLRNKGMSFVSGGKERLDEDDDEEDDDEYAEPARFGLGAKGTVPDDDEEEDEEEDTMTGVGLGFRASAPTAAAATPTATSRTSFVKPQYDGSTPLGRGFVPSSATEPVLKQGLKDEPSSTSNNAPKPSAFSKTGGGKAKSFAARMMEKMGYVEGQGLGAEGQGRNVIIEPTLRPQGAGLGAVKEMSKQEKEEMKRQKKLRGEEVVDSEEEDKKRKRERRKKRAQGLDSGTASGGSTPARRPKTKYVTVNDMKKAAPGLHIPDAFAPILDMTGPGQKMLTSGSGLLTPTAGTETVERTEARKLAGRAQRDLTAFVEEWKTLEERKAWLDMETHQRQQELDEVEGEFSKLQIFASVLDEVQRAAAAREWDPVINGLRKVEAEGSANNDDLAGIAVAAIHPFMRDAVQGWLPLEDPKLGDFASDLMSIRGVLGLKNKSTNGNAVAKWDQQEVDGTHRHHQKSTTPYESMIYKLLFPKLVTAISKPKQKEQEQQSKEKQQLENWDVYDPTTLLAIFEKWDDLFPAFVRSQLLDPVARRLDEAVSNWNPLKEQRDPKKPQTLPHLWVFPWLQHLPAHHLEPKGTGLVADIRRKFTKLIDAWEFDRGVVPGLKPWKELFRPSKSQDQWKPLVMRHIVPSMAKYLRKNFRVDPSDQNPYIPMLEGIMSWTDIIAPSTIAGVIATEVFPMWHEVLYQWLTTPEADHDEIATWYQSWQEDILPELASQESIAAEFHKGLVQLQRAVELGPDVQAKLPRPDGKPAHHHHHPKAHHGRSSKADNKAAPAPPPPAAVPAEKTFRQEIEDWCTENDLRFMPMSNKTTDRGERYWRVTARMDGKGGFLSYFQGDLLVVERRKGDDIVLRRDQPERWTELEDRLLAEVE